MYVRPFPGPGRAVQISTTGGKTPCWSHDGKQIFYARWNPDLWRREYYAVSLVVEADALRPSMPEKLFQGLFIDYNPVRSYDVARDGRFLMIKVDPNSRARHQAAMAPDRIELVQNWFEELRAEVPVD